MAITIERTPFVELERDPDFYDLVEGYTRECAIPEFTPGEVQVDTYLAMEQVGALHVWSVRADEKLVGFLLILAHKLPHFGVLTAIVESIYVDPMYRAGGAGREVIAQAKTFASEIGARALMVSAPLGGKLAKVLRRGGFRHTNETFMWVVQ